MRNLVAASVLWISLPIAGADAQGLETTAEQLAIDRYVFVFADHVPRTDIGKRVSQLVSDKRKVNYVYQHSIRGFSATLPRLAAQAITRSGLIKFSEADQVFYANGAAPLALGVVGAQAVTAQSTQSQPWGITRVGGGTAVSALRKAWIVDTGVD